MLHLHGKPWAAPFDPIHARILELTPGGAEPFYLSKEAVPLFTCEGDESHGLVFAMLRDPRAPVLTPMPE